MPTRWDTGALLKYGGREGTLLYSHHIFTRDSLPAPKVFQNDFDLFEKTADINKRVMSNHGWLDQSVQE